RRAPLSLPTRRSSDVAPYINLYEELSCRENLTFLAKLRHANKEVNPDYWLEKTQIASVANQPFGKLSTGQQQRLRLASALFHEPDRKSTRLNSSHVST